MGSRKAVARRYIGYPGHLIVSDSCLFHLHTHVGRYCISTVGDYRPRYRHNNKERLPPRETIGVGRYFETYVFELNDAGDPSGGEIDSVGANEPDIAEANHETMVSKYERKP